MDRCTAWGLFWAQGPCIFSLFCPHPPLTCPHQDGHLVECGVGQFSVLALSCSPSARVQRMGLFPGERRHLRTGLQWCSTCAWECQSQQNLPFWEGLWAPGRAACGVQGRDVGPAGHGNMPGGPGLLLEDPRHFTWEGGTFLQTPCPERPG